MRKTEVGLAQKCTWEAGWACSWKETGGRHRSDFTMLNWWQRWDQSKNPLKSLQISHTVNFQRGEKKKNLTGHQPKLISLKIFPNNRLSFGLAWSTWAGLISNNPSELLSRFPIAKLLDDLLLIYRHKFPLCLWTWHGLNGLHRTCLTC